MATDGATRAKADHAFALRVALGAGLCYLVLCMALAMSKGGNAEWFLKLGENDQLMVQRAREVLGHEDVTIPFVDAHDGPLFWLVAHDPLLLHPEELEPYVDSGTYRAQRVFYPLAAPARLGGEQVLLWGLVASNLVAVGIGSYLTARLSRELRAPPRAALAFALNPLVIIAVLLDLSDVWALVGLVGAVLAVRRRRWGWAIVAGIVAVMSREVMLVGVLALAVGAVGRPVWDRVRMVAVPAAAAVAWFVYCHLRVSSGRQVTAFVVVPFAGWFDAYQNNWAAFGRWADALVAGVVLLVNVVVLVRFVQRRTPELWAAVPFVLMLPFIDGQVVGNATNSLRTLGPPITLLVLDLYANAAGVPVRWPRIPGRARRSDAPQPAT